MSRGCFTVRTRHAGQLHSPIRATVKVQSRAGQSFSTVQHLDPQVPPLLRRLPLAHNRGRARIQRLRNEIVAVRLLAGEGEKNVALLDLAGIIFQT